MTSTLLNRTVQAIVTNKSGGALAQGDVVIIDASTANSVTITTTSGYKDGKIGVVIEPNGIANNAQGMVAFEGWIPKVTLASSASLGNLIKCHSVAKQATPHAAPLVAGDFGQVLGTGTTPAAILLGHVEQGAAGGAPTSSEFVTTAIDGSLTNEVAIPGLAGSPDIRVGGANDDEFDTADASDPMTGWTTAGTPTTHDIDTTIKSHYYLKRNGAAGVNLTGIYKACPSIPFTVTAKISGLTSLSDFNLGGLFIAEATPGKLDSIEISFTTSSYKLKVERWTNLTTSAGAAIFDPGISQKGRTPIYFKIVVTSSTNVNYLWSPDGLIWNQVVTARDPGFTVGAVGLLVSPTGTGNAVEMAVDWIRFS